jgi:hybrid cluster-associated redox disulfide protein
MPIQRTTLVDDVMRDWPETIRIFLNRRMGCPGCPIACFHSVEDAAREHGIETEGFLTDLRAVAAKPARQAS